MKAGWNVTLFPRPVTDSPDGGRSNYVYQHFDGDAHIQKVVPHADALKAMSTQKIIPAPTLPLRFALKFAGLTLKYS